MDLSPDFNTVDCLETFTWHSMVLNKSKLLNSDCTWNKHEVHAPKKYLRLFVGRSEPHMHSSIS